MKKVFFAAAFSLTALATLSAQKLQFDKKFVDVKTNEIAIDYGTVSKSSDGTRVIEFTNTGSAPLIITQVKPSCGCTSPEYSKTPILPGKKGKVMVKYNMRPGAFKKSVEVYTNDAEQGRMVFYIKGNITE